MYWVEGNYDKSVRDIKGVFFVLDDKKIKISVVANLFEKRQSLLEDFFEADLQGFHHD